ncbi:hypothetical protein KSP40_PGU013245 [Platanthera guangdongensis]|uniref:Uncharacterized protein n=1 Tax=Platanthera guangdongensis TaxID=2320717 RepID=A0ABR2M6C4_9ASPA
MMYLLPSKLRWLCNQFFYSSKCTYLKAAEIDTHRLQIFLKGKDPSSFIAASVQILRLQKSTPTGCRSSSKENMPLALRLRLWRSLMLKMRTFMLSLSSKYEVARKEDSYTSKLIFCHHVHKRFADYVYMLSKISFILCSVILIVYSYQLFFLLREIWSFD